MDLKPEVTKTHNLGLDVLLALPATPVVTTADQKVETKIDFTADDTLLATYIEVATLYVQKKIGRALINQTVVAEWDSVGGVVPLPYIPVSEITSVKTVAENGDLTILELNAGYSIRNNKIRVSTGLGLRVTYIAGYGAASTNVPTPLIQAVKRITTSLYDNRNDEMMETNIDQLAFNSMALIQPYINYGSI